MEQNIEKARRLWRADGQPLNINSKEWDEAERRRADIEVRADGLRRADGQPLNGTLTFKMLVIQGDWDVVREMGPQQRLSHGESALTAADWEELRRLAAQDGVEL